MTIDPNTLKALAAVLSIVGSGLLAWRVKRILEALTFVADMHERNITQIASNASQIVIATNANRHVERAKGTALLVFGFVCLLVSGALNLAALYL